VPKRRVGVFVDYQNCYGAARETFHDSADPGYIGNIHPHVLAHLLASKDSGAYELVFVGVYCGIADPRRDPRTAAARQKQIAAWQKSGAVVFARPLRYPSGWPKVPAEEKGVDVKMSIDVVMGAVTDSYDVAILASCDTDLAPVVEALLQMSATTGKPAVELIAWKGRQNKIGVPGVALTYRWVADGDYRAMRDQTDYNR